MKRPAMWADIHTDAVYGIAREMQFHIDQGLAQVGRQAIRYADTARDEALRSAGLLATGEKIASGSTIIDMKNRLIKQLQEEGFMTVQYGQGPRAYQVPLDAYANMVARSTTREAGNQARENQLTDNGYDLVEMSEHYPTCEVCATLQGRVYSISGKDNRFSALSVAFSNGYHNVHPNCRHVIVPWIESLQTPEEVQAAIAKSNQPLEDTRSRQEVELYKKQQAQHRQARQDLYQYERYKARLGDDAPKSYGAFRRVKKAGGKTWDDLQGDYRMWKVSPLYGKIPKDQREVLSERHLRHMLKPMEELRARHPEAFEGLSEIGFENLPAGAYAQHSFTPERPKESRITFNRAEYSDIRALTKAYRHDIKVGLHPAGGWESIGAHEMGHRLDLAHWLNMSGHSLSDTTPLSLSNAAALLQDWRGCVSADALVDKASVNLKLIRTDAVKGLSLYATQNAHETIAEAVADYMANGGKANPISDEIIKLLEEGLR